MPIDNAQFEAIRSRPAYRAALWCTRFTYACFLLYGVYVGISLFTRDRLSWWPGFEAFGPGVFSALMPLFLLGALGLLTARRLYLRVGIRMSRKPSDRIGLKMDDPAVAVAVNRDLFFKRRRPLYDKDPIAPKRRD
jgi:hypothetical protein